MEQNNEKDECWARLEQVIQMSGMSTNSFAKHIGLAHGENLYQIKKGNNRISPKVADCVCEKFPAVDKTWLLTGKMQPVSYPSAEMQESLIEMDVIVDRRREEFVKAAMMGLCAKCGVDDKPELLKQQAREAVMIADATIAMLDKTE